MLVYRVEKEFDLNTMSPDEGFTDAKNNILGPYHGHLSSDPIMQQLSDDLEIAHSDDAHPAPQDDGFDEHFNTNLIFGFESPHQAQEWFAGFGERLDEAGFMVSVYDVPNEDTVIGNRQMAFFPYRSTRVRQYPASRFIN